MPKCRSENRNKAFEIFKEHNGKITNRKIAEILEEKENTISNWKCRDKWNVVLQKNDCSTTKKRKDFLAKDEKIVAEEVEQVIGNSELTDKQRLFCCFYVRCFNATKAYQKAYKVGIETAMAAGSRMLRNVKVREEIQRLKESKLNREMLDESDIFQKYMDIAFADITDYVEFGREKLPVMGPFGPIKVKDKDGNEVELQKEVNSVRFKESADVDGTIITEVKQGRDGASIKLADRMKALDWLTAHMNFATEEQKARIAALRAKVSEDESEVQDDGFIEALKGMVSKIWEE